MLDLAAECFDAPTLDALAKLRLSAKLAARVDRLAERAKEGNLTSRERAEVRANPMVTVFETASGGHLGFLGRRPRRFWSDHAIMEWIATHQAKELTAGSLAIPIS